MQFPSTQYNALFQSTLSMRRATYIEFQRLLQAKVSIHALHEESDVRCTGKLPNRLVSIHALHEESDRKHNVHFVVIIGFNPRSP